VARAPLGTSLLGLDGFVPQTELVNFSNSWPGHPPPNKTRVLSGSAPFLHLSLPICRSLISTDARRNRRRVWYKSRLLKRMICSSTEGVTASRENLQRVTRSLTEMLRSKDVESQVSLHQKTILSLSLSLSHTHTHTHTHTHKFLSLSFSLSLSPSLSLPPCFASFLSLPRRPQVLPLPQQINARKTS